MQVSQSQTLRVGIAHRFLLTTYHLPVSPEARDEVHSSLARVGWESPRNPDFCSWPPGSGELELFSVLFTFLREEIFPEL